MLIAVCSLICVTLGASWASLPLLEVIECCAHSPQGPKPADEKIKAICAAVVEGEKEFFFFSVPQEFRCDLTNKSARQREMYIVNLIREAKLQR